MKAPINIPFLIATFTHIKLRYGAAREAVQISERLYRTIDRAIGRLQKATGIACVPGCGSCCERDTFDVHPVECFLLAFELYRRGRLRDFEDFMRYGTEKRQCLFYTAQGNGNGSCSVYAWRPLTCRLFGFSSRKNKYGKQELVTCTAIKQTGAFARANGYLTTTTTLSLSDYAYRLYALPAALPYKRAGINEAIRAALMRIALITK